jgi:UDP-4-amino-4,6-dideoxy-N-acetyl-beta-L-altrosamine transaminase
MIPYGKQDINQKDIDSVIAVLKSEFLTQGPQVPLFEKAVADYCGVSYAVAVNSATSALHIACLALGLTKRDWIWTSPNTFVASANCGLYCGAQIDFVDIDPQTYNLCAKELEQKLIIAKQNNKLPKIVIPVHFAGQSCDMKRIHELSQNYGFKIVEDASHAIGGRYHGKKIGGCQYSDITVSSFHPVKIITTGEGGMALTNNLVIAQSLGRLRSHGITNKPEEMIDRPIGEIWNYQQIQLGFNYRMSDIHAALGRSQMQRLNEFVSKRHSHAKRYDKLLQNLPVTIPHQCDDSYSSFHLYVIRLKLNDITKTQGEVFTSLHEAGILVNLHYIPVYRQPYYEALGFDRGYCQEAEKYYLEAITLPLYPEMTELQQDQVVSTLTRVLAL